MVSHAEPEPSDGISSDLGAVSCKNATNCVAVGSYFTNSTPFQMLTERYDGTHWRIIAAPKPAHASATANLSGISCSSPTTCMAVGFYDVEVDLAFASFTERYG